MAEGTWSWEGGGRREVVVELEVGVEGAHPHLEKTCTPLLRPEVKPRLRDDLVNALLFLLFLHLGLQVVYCERHVVERLFYRDCQKLVLL